MSIALSFFERELGRDAKGEIEIITTSPECQDAMFGIFRLALLYIVKIGRASELGELSDNIKNFLGSGKGLNGKLKEVENKLRDVKDDLIMKCRELADAQIKAEALKIENSHLTSTIEKMNIDMIKMKDEFNETLLFKEEEATKNLALKIQEKEIAIHRLEEKLVEAKGLNGNLQNKLNASNEVKAELEKQITTIKAENRQKVDKSLLENLENLLEESRKETRNLRDQILAGKLEFDNSKNAYELKIVNLESQFSRASSISKTESERLNSEINKLKKQLEEREYLPARTSTLEAQNLAALEDFNDLEEQSDFTTLGCEKCKTQESELVHTQELLARTEKLLDETRGRMSLIQCELTQNHGEIRELKAKLKTAEEESKIQDIRDKSQTKFTKSEISKKGPPELSFASEMISKMVTLESDIKKLKVRNQLLTKELEEKDSKSIADLTIVYGTVNAFFAK